MEPGVTTLKPDGTPRYPPLPPPTMTTLQVARLQYLVRNNQPVTVAALVALWHCSVATARDTLALCGYVFAGSAGRDSAGPAWHHPDHAPEPEPAAPEPEPARITPPSVLVVQKPLPPSPQPRTSYPQPVTHRLPAWVTVDPIDLIADLEATRTTRTWLLANVEPDQWPHPHRTPCPDCKLWQPCLTLSRHRQATICEAVITQRRLSHANLPNQPDLHRTPARFGPPGQEDLRDLHPAQSAAIAAR